MIVTMRRMKDSDDGDDVNDSDGGDDAKGRITRALNYQSFKHR